MSAKITSFECKIPMVIPNIDNIVQATVKSDVYEGITIEIPAGIPMYELHDMILSGTILEIAFFHKPAEKKSA